MHFEIHDWLFVAMATIYLQHIIGSKYITSPLVIVAMATVNHHHTIGHINITPSLSSSSISPRTIIKK